MSSNAAANAKQELRERMRGVRSSIPMETRRHLAERVEQNLFGVRELTEAKTVLLFYSFGSEVPTAAMVTRLLSEGRRVLLPFIGEEGMEAAELLPGDPLVETGYGPKEPGRRVAVDPPEVDAVVTPGLAFDRRGRRLGYGGGHYDRYLKRLSPAARRIGLAFSQQVVENVPSEAGDEPVHVVVTENEIIECRG
jgi:5-formyltetrahydrofolate cyclo-ligase